MAGRGVAMMNEQPPPHPTPPQEEEVRGQVARRHVSLIFSPCNVAPSSSRRDWSLQNVANFHHCRQWSSLPNLLKLIHEIISTEEEPINQQQQQQQHMSSSTSTSTTSMTLSASMNNYNTALGQPYTADVCQYGPIYNNYNYNKVRNQSPYARTPYAPPTYHHAHQNPFPNAASFYSRTVQNPYDYAPR